MNEYKILGMKEDTFLKFYVGLFLILGFGNGLFGFHQGQYNNPLRIITYTTSFLTIMGLGLYYVDKSEEFKEQRRLNGEDVSDWE